MTDLAARVKGQKIGSPGFQPQPVDDLLQISGTDPQTIYVVYRNTFPDHPVGFGLHPDGPFFFHGIEWAASKDLEIENYAMFITYVLASPEVLEIVCQTLHYSEVYQPTPDVQPRPPRQQNMCIPWGRAAYWFGVKVPDLKGSFKLVDPIIVVTPIDDRQTSKA